MSSSSSSELKLHPRSKHSEIAPEDRGPILRADAVAEQVWKAFGLKVSAKWVIEKMAGPIGFKIGKPWYFYRGEAELWRDEWIAQQRRGGAQ